MFLYLISVHPLGAPVKQTQTPPSADLGIFPFLRRLEATAAAKANAAGAAKPAPAAMVQLGHGCAVNNAGMRCIQVSVYYFSAVSRILKIPNSDKQWNP